MTGMTDWDFEPLVVPEAITHFRSKSILQPLTFRPEGGGGSFHRGISQQIEANQRAIMDALAMDLFVDAPHAYGRSGGYFAGDDFLDTRTLRDAPFTAGIVIRAPWKTETAERRHYGEPITIPDDWMAHARYER